MPVSDKYGKIQTSQDKKLLCLMILTFATIIFESEVKYMRSIVVALKQYKLKKVVAQGPCCPGGNPYKPVFVER